MINLVDAREEEQLIKLIKKGDVGFRVTQLGFCMKSANCEYGGIESASKKWAMPIHHWKQALNRFMIEFEDRLTDFV